VAGHVVSGLGLQDHRGPPQPRVVEDAGEGGEADLPFPAVGVAVAPRAEGAERIVEVQGPQGREADPPGDLRHHLFIPRRLVERVAGGEGVAGVEADPHSFRG
jgi:hypothetical protein